ncbi:hypothetical protein K1W54_22485 [Micromonospora sp. CPCC 205371]|nr:hypothetical protein [Micromonospora sp. CPCC 205371]
MRLRRPSMRVFAPNGRPAPTATELRYMTDYLAEFGMAPDLDLYARGGGHTFTSMCGALLDGLVAELPTLDAAVLAYHLPDLQVIEVAGCYLSGRLPGSPPVFSVSGQGVGAPFTALRVLDCLRRSGTLADGAVFVLDQTTAPYPDSSTHDGAVRDCALLLCTAPEGGDAGVTLDFLDERQVADPAEALDALARRLPRPRILAGRTLTDRLDKDFRARLGIVDGPARHLCTSAWAALTEHWPRDGYTVVADYDPHAGRLFQAGLRPGRPV